MKHLTVGDLGLPEGAQRLGFRSETRHLLAALRSEWREARLQRDAGQISSEYDQGAWKSILVEKRWLKAPSLSAYLTGEDDREKICKIGGRLFAATARSYYAWRLNAIPSLLRRYVDDRAKVCEIGSGYGFNVFTLAAAGAQGSLVGLELSENGRAAFSEIAAHFGVSNARTGPIDFLDPRSEGWREVAGHPVFTYHCIEQLPHSLPQILDNLLAARPSRVVHFEPTEDALGVMALGDWVNRLYIRRMDYPRRLLTELKRREREGRLRIVDVVRPGFAPLHRHDHVVAVWEPV